MLATGNLQNQVHNAGGDEHVVSSTHESTKSFQFCMFSVFTALLVCNILWYYKWYDHIEVALFTLWSIWVGLFFVLLVHILFFIEKKTMLTCSKQQDYIILQSYQSCNRQYKYKEKLSNIDQIYCQELRKRGVTAGYIVLVTFTKGKAPYQLYLTGGSLLYDQIDLLSQYCNKSLKIN